MILKLTFWLVFLLYKNLFTAKINCDIYLLEREDRMENKNIPEEYQPISMWGYFGYEILFALPLKMLTLKTLLEVISAF